MRFSTTPMIPFSVKSVIITQYPDIFITHYQENLLNSSQAVVVYGKRGDYDLKIIFDRDLQWQRTIYSGIISEFSEDADKVHSSPEKLRYFIKPEDFNTAIPGNINRFDEKRRDPFFKLHFREEKLRWNNKSNIQLSPNRPIQQAMVKDLWEDN
jgi:hypothetical protein